MLGSNGLWNQLIQENYLQKTSNQIWLRMQVEFVHRMSHYWNGFIRVLSQISRLLGWKVGDGCLIKLRIDPIAKLNTKCIISSKVLSYLNDYGINSLNEDHNMGEGTVSKSYWLIANDLELDGPWKDEWSHFIRGLFHEGIKLTEKKDKLLQMYNIENVEVSSKLAYELIVTSNLENLKGWKYQHLWI